MQNTLAIPSFVAFSTQKSPLDSTKTLEKECHVEIPLVWVVIDALDAHGDAAVL
jgi:hypothetical protein